MKCRWNVPRPKALLTIIAFVGCAPASTRDNPPLKFHLEDWQRLSSSSPTFQESASSKTLSRQEIEEKWPSSRQFAPRHGWQSNKQEGLIVITGHPSAQISTDLGVSWFSLSKDTELGNLIVGYQDDRLSLLVMELWDGKVSAGQKWPSKSLLLSWDTGLTWHPHALPEPSFRLSNLSIVRNQVVVIDGKGDGWAAQIRVDDHR